LFLLNSWLLREHFLRCFLHFYSPVISHHSSLGTFALTLPGCFLVFTSTSCSNILVSPVFICPNVPASWVSSFTRVFCTPLLVVTSLFSPFMLNLRSIAVLGFRRGPLQATQLWKAQLPAKFLLCETPLTCGAFWFFASSEVATVFPGFDTKNFWKPVLSRSPLVSFRVTWKRPPSLRRACYPLALIAVPPPLQAREHSTA